MLVLFLAVKNKLALIWAALVVKEMSFKCAVNLCLKGLRTLNKGVTTNNGADFYSRN